MSAIFQVAAVSVVAFLSTNTDNLIIYTGFITALPGKKFYLILSYYIAMTLLLVIIFFLSKSLSKIPVADVKYLGLVLVGIGIFFLVKFFFKKEQLHQSRHINTRNTGVILGVTMLMDSFDTVSVFVPLFADSNESSDLVVGSSFFACYVIWGVTGLYISKLRLFRFLTLHSDKVIPVIMMLVGFYIFLNTYGDVE